MELNKSETFLPWMRNPVNVDSYEECALQVVPQLDPRFLSLSHLCTYTLDIDFIYFEYFIFFQQHYA